MSAEDDFIKKLMVSKAIMDKHKQMPRAGDGARVFNTPMVETYDAPAVSYNLPQEFIQETSTPQPQQQKGPMTEDRIMSSKLPDEIKRLMIEHPIAQPNGMGGPTLSNDLIERATRLMKQDQSGYIPESAKPKSQPAQSVEPQQTSSTEKINYKLIQKMINEAVNNALKENGLIMESSEKSNEIFSFKVGKHVFEGKVTKIKKLA